MKKTLFLLGLLLPVFVDGQTPTNVSKSFLQMELNANWKFHQAGKPEWLPATVPGTVHTDLLNAKKIPDPYYRTNEKDLQWIDKVNWEYQTNIEITDLMLNMAHIELDFKGLDTYADVYVNEHKVISADNMFRSWKAECKQFLKIGQNNIRVYFKSPIIIGLQKLEENKYALPASNDQSVNGQLGDNPVSVFTRKAGYHYGWDWGPRFVTSGIWRPVYLNAWNDARIDDIYVLQNEVNTKLAKLEVQYEINVTKAGTYHLEIVLNDQSVASKDVPFKEGLFRAKVNFEIKSPKLWWSHGLGEAYLYQIKANLSLNNELIDFKTVNTGVRTLELVQQPDADGKGKSFYFKLNGVPVFAKGANYIPNDVFLPRVTNQEYERVIKLATDANMNMLRVWGGGIYENDYFYDLCDKNGILIWQDFMFACSMYPGGEEFMENIRQEVIENVKRLRGHTCIALWCGNNEIETAWAEWEEKSGWGWKELYTKEQRTEIWKNYDQIFHQIMPKAISEYTQNGAYWPSSPSAGKSQLSKIEARSGDVHYWGVWHGKHPLEMYKTNISRFMSEYGFQSFPEFKTVKQYTIPSDWDITSEVMAAHQRSGIGNLRIKEYMKDWYKDPKDFQSFLYVSSVLQAEALKMAFEGHRMQMPFCMGSLYWQINDCWPVASWSSTDYYRRWKALHYFAKKAYEPIILAFDTLGQTLKVFVVSDELKVKNTKLNLKLIDFRGKELWKKEMPVKVEANTSRIYFEIPQSTLLKGVDIRKVVLIGTLSSENKEISANTWYFQTPKDLDLPKTNIQKKIEKTATGYKITLLSNVLAKNVYLSFDNSDGFFSDNYFDLLPNTPKIIEFQTSKEIKDFEQNLVVISIVDTF